MYKKHTRHNKEGLLEIQCQRCEGYYLEIDFNLKNNDQGTGRCAWCINCRREYNKTYWVEGLDRMDENLKITFKMRSPIATVGLIHLDALLGTAIFMRRYIRLPKTAGRRESIGDTIRRKIPLFSVAIEGKRIFSGSAGIATGCVSVVRWKKRWDNEYDALVDFDNRKQRIDHKASYFKQYNMPLVILSTPEMIFYARGDRRQIESLLNHISNIGKKSSQGFGEIREWKVEEVEKDWSVWKDGQPMRAIPSSPQAGFLLQQTGYCFPYWDRRNQGVCIVPRLEYGSAQT